MKKALLWVVDWNTNNKGCPITADLFFSSEERFHELCNSFSSDHEQLVEVDVPDNFDYWDFIPENY